MVKQRKQVSACQRMRRNGKVPTQLWLAPSDLAIIHKAAKAQGRPMAQWIRYAALIASYNFNANGLVPTAWPPTGVPKRM